MDTEAAVEEFVTMMRLGASALKQVVLKDSALASEIEPDINELLYLIDRLVEVGDQIIGKTQLKGARPKSQ